MFAVIGLVLHSVFATEGRGAIWSVSTANRILVTLSVGLGVALPFALRFGWFGLTVLGIGMQVLGIVAYLIVRTFATNLPFRDAFAAVADYLAGTHSRLGGPLSFVAITLVLVLFNLASYKFAVALFERRELRKLNASVVLL